MAIDPRADPAVSCVFVCHDGSHWVAVVNAVRVDPEAVAIGEPHKFDELGWVALDALPSPLHSQLPATVDLFREWTGPRPRG